MILRLLKKHRTTVRIQTNSTNQSSWSAVFKSFQSLTRFGVAIAVATIALPESSEAQTFRDPTVRTQPATSMVHPDALRSKIEHAEALMGQMKRVQREQGAPGGFAQQAYQAQQAYLAQLAYDEYQDYLRMMRRKEARERGEVYREDPGQNYQASYQPPTAPTVNQHRQSSYSETNFSSGSGGAPQPNRYAPPVHIPPPMTQRAPVPAPVKPQRSQGPATMSFGDVPPLENRATQEQTGPEFSVIKQTSATSHVAQPMRRVAPQPKPVEPAHRHQGSPLPLNHQNLSIQPNPRPINREPVQHSLQTGAHHATPHQHRPYIISENSVGLQDRIASLLSKPGYRGSTQPQRAVAKSQPQTTRPEPKQLVSTDRTRKPRHTSPVETAGEIREPELRKFSVSQADRKGPIHRFQPNAAPVRQVSMVEPVQDPFNDGFAPVNPMPQKQPLKQPRSFRPQAPIDPPALNQPLSNRPPRVARQTQEFRQISILKRQQDQEDRSESMFQQPTPNELPSPTEDSGAQDPFGLDDKDEDIKRIDENLNQELERRGNGLREQDDDLESEIKELEAQMDEELNKSDSVMEDESIDDDETSKPTQKSCDEFRTQLLNSSIRDIALDISPPASSNRDQFVAISRTWTDRSGMTIATGTMVDLRRGYVILDAMSGRIKIPYGKLSDADLAAISEYWELPEVCTVGGVGTPTRNWIQQTYTWKATNACHKPLYFENIQLERYGHTHGPFVQPFHSAAHFFVRLATLPYHTAIHPPNECEYSLGLYRPGNCAPWLKDPIPFSLDGARRQASFITGLSITP